MQILLAEDDLRLGRLVAHMFDKEGIKVDWVVDGEMAFEYAVYSSYDLIILDWMMPGESGIDVCGRLRKQGYQGLILMLTAKDAVEDRVIGLDTGADDYLIKPFEFSELMARIRALSRRSSNKLIENVVTIGNRSFNKTTKVITYNEKEIFLSGREFQMLDLLIQNKGQVVPREVILDRVWGLESEVTSNNLDAYIRLLRKKIDPPGGDTLIHTIRGVGYRVEE